MLLLRRKRCWNRLPATSRTTMATTLRATGGSHRCLVSSTNAVAASAAVRTPLSAAERATLRAARKERATQLMQQEQQQQAGTAAAATTGTSSGSSKKASSNLTWSRYVWYLGVAIPTGLIVWGFNDPNSPPAQLAQLLGITNLITEISKPTYDKLLPDWSQIPNVPHDIPVPMTLVLDLENTLVSSTWDRKYGWRHAKRPHVDRFLHELAQYYEIVLYSPSIDGIADPVVTNLDKDGCILHRLYRDATYYHNGVHVKDLKRLNRPLNRMIVIDDDPLEVQFNPENWIPVKPYTDPTDRSDTTLLRLLPFLIEIAREGYDDIPGLLAQYRGMDADQIADEQERRIRNIREMREQRARQGLGGLARGGGHLPPPELVVDEYAPTNMSSTPQLTAKDIAGAAPPTEQETSGFIGWMHRRQKEKEEHQMRKLEKWNEVMLKKQRKRQEEMEKLQQQQKAA